MCFIVSMKIFSLNMNQERVQSVMLKSVESEIMERFRVIDIENPVEHFVYMSPIRMNLAWQYHMLF